MLGLLGTLVVIFGSGILAGKVWPQATSCRLVSVLLLNLWIHGAVVHNMLQPPLPSQPGLGCGAAGLVLMLYIMWASVATLFAALVAEAVAGRRQVWPELPRCEVIRER